MHYPTERIAHTMAFVTPVVEHWLEQEIAQWVHHEGSIQRPITPQVNVPTTEHLYLCLPIGLHMIPHWPTHEMNVIYFGPRLLYIRMTVRLVGLQKGETAQDDEKPSQPSAEYIPDLPPAVTIPVSDKVFNTTLPPAVTIPVSDKVFNTTLPPAVTIPVSDKVFNTTL